jgi:fermentation-respiration switch protein FrsA (DUF1100 family)
VSSYRFPSARWLERVRTPTLVIHGERDRVIPVALGRRLYDAVRGPKRLLIVEGGDHNDLEPPRPDPYWQAVDEFIDSLKTP